MANVVKDNVCTVDVRKKEPTENQGHFVIDTRTARILQGLVVWGRDIQCPQAKSLINLIDSWELSCFAKDAIQPDPVGGFLKALMTYVWSQSTALQEDPLK